MTNEATFPSRISFPSWQSQVQAATDETDTAKLLSRVHAAESAIFNRLQELARLPQSGRVQIAEREFLAEALETLRRLKRDRLGFPDWVEKKSNS